jgi:hypothetical protein
MREELLVMRKEHESMKASYFYKAESLEGELQKHVAKRAHMKAKVAKIRAVLEALNHMVQDGLHEGPSDYDNEGLTKQAKGLAAARLKPGETYE